MISLFAPAPHIERLPLERIDPLYRRLRWQIFTGIFVGYAGYYLVRNNFALATPFLLEQGYTKTELGLAGMGVPIAYGLSKFLMGNVSDRSNPRFFLGAGLLLSALVMFLMGTVPFATSGVAIMFLFLLLNSWLQGMGWPPCGRTMVHWWSHHERGRVVSAWNVAHNVGGGAVALLFLFATNTLHLGWHSAFYVPAICAAAIALFAIATMRDTPQSLGLPPIEEYRNDRMPDYQAAHEREFNAREIFVTYVLRNRLLWYIALANVFVYFIRYGVLNWSPTYLKEVKQATLDASSWGYALYEFAGIPGTLLCGWISDKVFNGRRAPAGMLFMSLVSAFLVLYWLNPPGNPVVDTIALIGIGGLIYGPVMLIGLHALELAPKKAAGTAAGFTGMFGYLGGGVAASALMGFTVERLGWDGGFVLLLAACAIAIALLALTLRHENSARAAVTA